MGVLCITVGLVITILDIASNARRISQEQVDMEKAMYVAEGGLERGARFMESNLVVIVSSSTGLYQWQWEHRIGDLHLFHHPIQRQRQHVLHHRDWHCEQRAVGQ